MKLPEEASTPPPTRNDRVSLSRRLAWGLGGGADSLVMNGINQLVLPIYNVGLGLDALLVGLAQTIPRFIDALFDPLLGNLSDNTRSRWGRRRPYIFAGAIGCAVCFAVLWVPSRHWGQGTLFAFLLAASILYYLFYSIFIVPYTALGFELTSDSNERTRVLAWRVYFSLAFGLSVPWLYKLALNAAPGGNELTGMRIIGPVVGAVILLTGLAPAIFCRERVQVLKQTKIHFLRATAFTFRNRPFLALVSLNLIVKLGLYAVGPLAFYLNVYYVCGGDKSRAATLVGVGGTLMMLSGFVGLKLITWLSVPMGKRPAMVLCLLVGIFAYCSFWWAYSPLHPWAQFAPTMVIGAALNGAWLLLSSMLSDVCEEDEYETGLRREGMYSAVFSFMEKAGFASAGILTGLVLKLSGYLDGQMPSEGVMWNMRMLFIVGQCAGLFLGLVALVFYPLTAARMVELRAVLDERARRENSGDE